MAAAELPPELSQKPSSELPSDFHNHNCFAYLTAVVRDIPDFIQSRFQLEVDLKYNSKTSYANLYASFLTRLEADIAQGEKGKIGEWLKTADEEDKNKYNHWIHQIYANHNQILKTTYTHLRDTVRARRLFDARPEEQIQKTLAASTSEISHNTTPQSEGSWPGRFSAMIADNFKPMFTTSIPSTRDYQYTEALRKENTDYPQELRFGTQAQRHDGEVRISPLFEEWLRRSPVLNQVENKVSHVYFNLLGVDRTDGEGEKERALSLALHQLEEKHPNLVVITLPADKELLKSSTFERTDKNKTLTAQKSCTEMLAIAKGKKIRATQDFVISPKAKQLLYGVLGESYDTAKENGVLTELLDKSFKAMGFKNFRHNVDDMTTLSPAEQQAVWFHFTKYEMPKYILKTLKPVSFNMSCKDGIDRGGVASAYYNLLCSFETTSPMSRDEFEEALHAAAALVKGRGLNHHYEMIWNAVNYYVNTNVDTLLGSPEQAWLIHWRNDNTPKAIASRDATIQKVCEQNITLLTKKLKEVEEKDEQYSALIRSTTQVLAMIKHYIPSCTAHDKRLLLEVASLTTQMVLSPELQKMPSPQYLKRIFAALDSKTILGQIKIALQSFVSALRELFMGRSSSVGDPKKYVDEIEGVFLRQSEISPVKNPPKEKPPEDESYLPRP